MLQMQNNENKKIDFDKIKQFVKGKNIILIAGIIGILLIFISDIKPNVKETPVTTSENYCDEYSKNLENKLEEMLVNVEGTGNVKVMVTIESGEQYIYAQAEKTNSDLSTNDANETKETNEKSTYQSDYIIVEDDSGGKKALTETTLQPEIKGVAVVCVGADNIAVQDNITQMVSTVLGISTNRVCVIKMINGK